MKTKKIELIFRFMFMVIAICIIIPFLQNDMGMVIIPILFVPTFAVIQFIIGIVGLIKYNKKDSNEENNDNVTFSEVTDTEIIKEQKEVANGQNNGAKIAFIIFGLYLIFFGLVFSLVPTLIVIGSEGHFDFFLLPFVISGAGIFIGGIVALVKGITYNKKKNNSKENTPNNTPINQYDNTNSSDYKDDHVYYDDDEYFVKYCSNCGASLSKSDTVCPYCNTKCK